MLVETIVWIMFTLCFGIIFFFKDRFFNSRNYFGSDKIELQALKEKSKVESHMSLEDQKELITLRGTLGEDLLSVVCYTLIFLVALYVLMLVHIFSFIVGLCTIVVFASIFSYIVGTYGFDNYKDYQIITSLLNFLYVGILVLYLRSFDNINGILFIVLSIILLFGCNWVCKKFK